jgi:outer membrane protein assembly factor BamB
MHGILPCWQRGIDDINRIKKVSGREKQILALRTAYIAGIFALIVGLVMLLNYRQLVTTDPLESELLKTMVERLKSDASNEQLKTEIRNLDLMARNAYFTSQWQIRAGAFLLMGGVIIMVIALRLYYSLKAKIALPDSAESSLDIELLISRKWILYTLAVIFGLGLLASFLSIDHLSGTYAETETIARQDAIPVQQIIPKGETDGVSTEIVIQSELPVSDEGVVAQEQSQISEAAVLPAQAVEQTAAVQPTVTTKETSVADLQNNFPSFRGAFGLGIAHQKNAPVSWNGASGENIIWKVKIPLQGYNSPVIWNNQVFVTGANSTAQSIYAYDLASGNLVWEHKVSGIERASNKAIKPTDDTGYAAPTVATDGKHIYAIFATGDLVCVTMQGQRIWGKNMGIPDNHYGHSSSLLLWKNHLFIQFDTNVAGKVLALHTLTGDLIWETPRTSKISWASPILANVGGRYELVLASSPEVAAYDIETGKELWKVNCMSGEVGPSPGYYNGIVYAANEYAKLIAIKPGTTPVTVWENNEYLPEVASPVAIDGLLFIATSYGVVACFDAATGDLLWEYEANQGFYASPVVADGKVYFLDMDGIMHIFSIDKTMKLIGTPELNEQSVSTPAFAQSKILIRGYDHLYCIGK